MAANAAFYPVQSPITAYGNGGFRFAEMSHRGALLCLPDGMHGWQVDAVETLTAENFAPALARLTAPAVLLLGTGANQIWPDEGVMRAFANAGIGLEVMSTGAAARTYNVLLAEGRSVAAALLAVP